MQKNSGKIFLQTLLLGTCLSKRKRPFKKVEKYGKNFHEQLCPRYCLVAREGHIGGGLRGEGKGEDSHRGWWSRSSGGVCSGGGDYSPPSNCLLSSANASTSPNVFSVDARTRLLRSHCSRGLRSRTTML